MGMFNMFGDAEHRVFNYRPRYYDPEEEARKAKFGKVDGTLDREKKDGTYTPGSYLQGSFRDGNYSRTRSHSNRVQNFIGIFGLVLIFVVLYFIAKFYTIL